MAFVDPNEVVPGPGVPPSQQQAPIAAGGAGVGGSTKAASTPGQNLPAQPSAQLSSYLAANQPQASALAGNVAQTVGNQVNAAGAAIQPAVNTYTGQLYTVPTDAQANAALAASPSTLTPDQTTTLQNEIGAAGKAPSPASTFEASQGYQDAASGIQKAVEQAGLWNAGNDVGSLSTALSPFEGPNATTGDRTLDSLLLSQIPDAYGKIQTAVAPAAGLQSNLAGQSASADAALQSAIAQDTATTQAANDSAGQYSKNLNTTLAGYLAKAQADANTYNSKVNNLSGQEAMIQPQIAAFQDAIAKYNAMQASNPADNLLPVATAGRIGTIPETVGVPPVSQLATKEQYADVQALLNLYGAGAPSNLPIDPSTASQAGTYTPPTNSIPILNNLIDPIYAPVEGQLVQAQNVYDAHPNNPALANDYGTYSALQTALQNLISAMNQNSTQTPPPPTGAVGPQNGQPGNEAWYNYIMTNYPGLDGMPSTYQAYLDQFNGTGGGGIHAI